MITLDAALRLRLMGYVRALLRGPEHESLEDIVQSVLLKLSSAPPVNTIKCEEAYLRVACRNAVNRYRATRYVPPETYSMTEEDYHIADHPHHPDLQHDLQAAVDTLPSPLQQVAVLMLRDGYRSQEVARLLGVTVRTVWRRFARATTLLRAAFKEYRE